MDLVKGVVLLVLGVRVLIEAMSLADYMPQYADYPQVTFVSLVTKCHAEVVKLARIVTHLAKG